MIGAFTDELGELGKQIVREAVAVPKDIAGKALESLGTPKSQKQQQKPTTPTNARAALTQLASLPKPKEPSIWEKMQQEDREKKELAKQREQKAAAQALPVVKSKRPRGDLYGLKAKRAGAEVGKNVRQD